MQTCTLQFAFVLIERNVTRSSSSICWTWRTLSETDEISFFVFSQRCKSQLLMKNILFSIFPWFCSRKFSMRKTTNSINFFFCYGRLNRQRCITGLCTILTNEKLTSQLAHQFLSMIRLWMGTVICMRIFNKQPNAESKRKRHGYSLPDMLIAVYNYICFG